MVYALLMCVRSRDAVVKATFLSGSRSASNKKISGSASITFETLNKFKSDNYSYYLESSKTFIEFNTSLIEATKMWKKFYMTLEAVEAEAQGSEVEAIGKATVFASLMRSAVLIKHLFCCLYDVVKTTKFRQVTKIRTKMFFVLYGYWSNFFSIINISAVTSMVDWLS